MVDVLEQFMVDQIAAIGVERKPAEACGLLLPQKMRGHQVIELPNRSKTPQDSFTMLGSDVALALENIIEVSSTPDEWLRAITVWHTHPGGNLGPSRFDLNNKPTRMKCLVVTLFEDGQPPKATWY